VGLVYFNSFPAKSDGWKRRSAGYRFTLQKLIIKGETQAMQKAFIRHAVKLKNEQLTGQLMFNTVSLYHVSLSHG
jgi:hypothetical protein